MQGEFECACWVRVSKDDKNFGLRLQNFHKVNIKHIRNLFAQLKNKTSNRRQPFSKEYVHFSSESAEAFGKWLKKPNEPLPSIAYARLSNWFLTDFVVDRESPLGYAAKDLWVQMGFMVPRERLTGSKSN